MDVAPFNCDIPETFNELRLGQGPRRCRAGTPTAPQPP